MKKKILFCIEQPTLAYKYFEDIIRELNKYPDYEIEIFNLAAHKAVNAHLATLGNKVLTLSPGRSYKKQLFQIAKIIRKSRPDIIHAHESIPAFYAALALMVNFSSTKLIFHRHHSYYRDKTIHFMERLAFWRCNLAIAVSATAQQQAIDEHTGSKKKITYIHNGITLADSGMALPINMEAYKNRLVIVLIAWLVGRKGHEAAIEAMDIVRQKIPEAVLFFAGDGPQKAKLQEMILERKLEQHVVLLGEVKNIHALLQRTDISILPSEAEAFNLSILETMAAGKLSMASNIPSINECIQDGETGVSVPVDDPKVLADKLLFYLKNTTERERIAKNGYALYCKEFTTSAMVKKFINTYNTL